MKRHHTYRLLLADAARALLMRLRVTFAIAAVSLKVCRTSELASQALAEYIFLFPFNSLLKMRWLYQTHVPLPSNAQGIRRNHAQR